MTPDAKRRAVHLIREKPNLSEGRACDIVGVARRVVRYEPVRSDDGACASAYGNWRRNVAGSAIGGWAICSPVRGWRPITGI